MKIFTRFISWIDFSSSLYSLFSFCVAFEICFAYKNMQVWRGVGKEESQNLEVYMTSPFRYQKVNFLYTVYIFHVQYEANSQAYDKFKDLMKVDRRWLSRPPSGCCCCSGPPPFIRWLPAATPPLPTATSRHWKLTLFTATEFDGGWKPPAWRISPAKGEDSARLCMPILWARV